MNEINRHFRAGPLLFRVCIQNAKVRELKILGFSVTQPNTQPTVYLSRKDQIISSDVNIYSQNYSLFQQLQSELSDYFSGRAKSFSIPFDLNGSAFQKRVWLGLREIRFGQTISYGKQAQILGCPTAVRALASCHAKNPIHLLLPCHRVIRSNGTLSGYAGGGEPIKRFLIHHEQKLMC